MDNNKKLLNDNELDEVAGGMLNESSGSSCASRYAVKPPIALKYGMRPTPKYGIAVQPLYGIKPPEKPGTGTEEKNPESPIAPPDPSKKD